MNNEPILNKSQTDWTKLDTMEDEDIDFSDCQEITPEMLKSATIRRGVKSTPEKETVTLQLDVDVLTWFKTQGTSYQNQINALLRAYMEAHQ